MENKLHEKGIHQRNWSASLDPRLLDKVSQFGYPPYVSAFVESSTSTLRTQGTTLYNVQTQNQHVILSLAKIFPKCALLTKNTMIF